MRTVPILQRRLDASSQGVIALFSFLTLDGCCLNNRDHVHSPAAPGPAQGGTEGVVTVEPRLTLTEPPLPLPSDSSSDSSPWELCWGHQRPGHSAGPLLSGALASLLAGSHHTCMGVQEGLK